MTLEQQLKLYYAGKLKSSDSLYFGTTPTTIRESGMDELPLAFLTSDFKKSTQEKHNVPRRAIKALRANLNKALFSFGIDNKIGFVVPDIDRDGKPLLIGIEKDVKMDNRLVNAIRSAYGLDNPKEWLCNQISAGKSFVVYDEKGANSFLHPYGYSASREEGIKLLNETVPQQQPEVNKKYSLRDSAYMDAVDHGDTETAQRMVDEAAKAAGYTIKAYHGTTNQEEHSTWNAERREWDTTYTPITVFKRQYDEQAGHFFSADVVDMAPTDFEIKNAEPHSTATTNKSIGDIIGGSAGSNIPQERTKVNKKFSQRDPEAVEVNRAMEKENARLDVSLPFRCQNGTQKWQWNE